MLVHWIHPDIADEYVDQVDRTRVLIHCEEVQAPQRPGCRHWFADGMVASLDFRYGKPVICTTLDALVWSRETSTIRTYFDRRLEPSVKPSRLFREMRPLLEGEPVAVGDRHLLRGDDWVPILAAVYGGDLDAVRRWLNYVELRFPLVHYRLKAWSVRAKMLGQHGEVHREMSEETDRSFLVDDRILLANARADLFLESDVAAEILESIEEPSPTEQLDLALSWKFTAGDVERALEVFEEVIPWEEAAGNAFQSHMFWRRYIRAAALLHGGEECEPYIEGMEDNAETVDQVRRAIMARLHYLGDDAGARKQLESQASAIDSCEDWLFQGNFWAEAFGDRDQAIACFREAVEIARKPTQLVRIAEMWHGLGDSEGEVRRLLGRAQAMVTEVTGAISVADAYRNLLEDGDGEQRSLRNALGKPEIHDEDDGYLHARRLARRVDESEIAICYEQQAQTVGQYCDAARAWADAEEGMPGALRCMKAAEARAETRKDWERCRDVYMEALQDCNGFIRCVQEMARVNQEDFEDDGPPFPDWSDEPH
jgi:tetratricopeptide (TPR) repeat protein